MNNLLKSVFEEKHIEASIEGEWFCIQWTPDIVTNEVLNIGVGFIKNEKYFAKILNTFDRLECLYDQDAAFHIKFLTEIINESIKKNRSECPHPQIVFKHKGLAQGENIDEILESLYNQTVTLGRPKPSNQNEIFKSIGTNRLYKQLIPILKDINPFHYNSIVPENPYITIKDETGTHDLYLPFRNNSGVISSLASTVYADVKKVELNLLKAYTDIQLGLKLNKGRKPFIFTLKPNEQLDNLQKSKILQIQNKLDEFDWYMKKQNILIESHVTVSGLAQEIYDNIREAA